jgi:hypothetical protein
MIISGRELELEVYGIAWIRMEVVSECKHQEFPVKGN